MSEYETLSPILPEWEDIPEDDEAEPLDAESDHHGDVEPEDDGGVE